MNIQDVIDLSVGYYDTAVVKKDGTLEDFNVQKVVDAVNKSACRVLINFTEEEEKFICQ